MSLPTLPPGEAKRLLEQGAILVDVREADEHARENIPGARLMSLSKLDEADLALHAGQPVIVPGSMGAASYYCLGTGNDRFLSSASHGAGRAIARGAMGRCVHDARHATALGLDGVTCVTLREERRVEEAPAAYKPIAPIIASQVAAGMIREVVRFRPIRTNRGTRSTLTAAPGSSPCGGRICSRVIGPTGRTVRTRTVGSAPRTSVTSTWTGTCIWWTA